MRVDPLCTVLRFAPIGILFAVHCSHGHWPSDAECAERVIEYGFCADLFRERPASVLTHLFVHISSQHLLSNTLSMAATLVEFGEAADTAAALTDDEASTSSSTPRRQGSMASQLQTLLGERSRLRASLRTAGAFAVWALGGAIGGLGGQLLYNDSTVALRRERATRAAQAVRELQQAPGREGDGLHVLRTLSRHARVLRQRAEAFNTSVAAEAQAAVNGAMMMCGASAGVCALSGFNAVYYGRPITALCMVVPEVVLTFDVVNRCVALLSSSAGSSGNAELDAQRKALQSTWRTLIPGQTVGHAAHVGGFVAGAGIAYAWLCVQKRRVRGAQARSKLGSSEFIMNTTGALSVPTRHIKCTYSTVLGSKATRYFAVAPVKQYEALLAAQVRLDVIAMVGASTDGGVCCSLLGSGADVGDLNGSNSTSPFVCVCVGTVNVVQINRRFSDQSSLLGFTFEVSYAVYEFDGGRLLPLSTDPNPTVPFAWTVARADAFVNVVDNFLYALTRKMYLSELTWAPSIFAHVTVAEVDILMHSEGGSHTGTGPTLGVLQGHTGEPASTPPRSLHAPVLRNDTVVDYCTVLRCPITSAAVVPNPPMVTFNETAANGTVITYTYPAEVVYIARSYTLYALSECRGGMCVFGVLCGILMLILIVAAGVAFAVQRCRRIRSERRDEKRLLQRQVR